MIGWQQALSTVTSLELIGTLVMQVTLVCGLALAAARCCRRNSVLRHYLLMCGLAFALVLPLATSALHLAKLRVCAIPLVWHTSTAQQSASNDVATAVSSGAPVAMHLANQLAQNEFAGPEQQHSSGVQAAADPGPDGPAFNWQLVPPLLWFVWCAGGLLVLLRLLLTARGTGRLMRQVQELPPHQVQRIARLCRRAGIAPLPAVSISDAVRVPMVAGLRRPHILLPRWSLDELSDRELQNVLQHEWAHIVRGDQYTVLFQELAAALFWWHPLLRVLNRNLADAREEVCDNWALQACDPIHYGETLLRIGSRVVTGSTTAYSLSVVARRGTLSGRIAALLDPERKHMTRLHRSTAWGLVIVFGVVASLLAVTRLQFAEAQEPPAATDAAAVENPADENAAELPGRIFLSVALKAETDESRKYNRIISVDPNTGEWHELTEGHGPRVSPDGKTMMFHRDDELWSADSAEASGPGVVASDITGRIGWTPDSRHVIVSPGEFIEDQGWKHKTERISVDGLIRNELPIPASDGVDDVSPDGEWVVTVSDRHPPHGSGYQLYRMRLDGSQQERLTKDGLNVYARYSPDGHRIVYVHQKRSEGNSLYVYDFRDKSNVRITEEIDGRNSVGGACWSPDGRRLLVVRFDWQKGADGKLSISDPADAHYRLEIMNPDGTNVQSLSLKDVTMIWTSLPEWR